MVSQNAEGITSLVQTSTHSFLNTAAFLDLAIRYPPGNIAAGSTMSNLLTGILPSPDDGITTFGRSKRATSSKNRYPASSLRPALRPGEEDA